MKSFRNAMTVVLSVCAILLVLLLLFFTTTGFYCKVPTWNEYSAEPATPGETVWFLRRGTPFGFITSGDGIAMLQGFSPNGATRKALDTEFERLVHRRIIGRFGFSRMFYLKTTEGADLYTPVTPGAPQSGPQADPETESGTPSK